MDADVSVRTVGETHGSGGLCLLNANLFVLDDSGPSEIRGDWSIVLPNGDIQEFLDVSEISVSCRQCENPFRVDVQPRYHMGTLAIHSFEVIIDSNLERTYHVEYEVMSHE